MNPQCSIARLECALAGSLPADDEAALHRHLEACEECSAALERMAGGPAWCQEAAALLTEDELDAAVPTRGEWSEIDFTVEHLEPSDEPNVLGRLGGYDVLEIIGHGGMGVVLKGFDRELKRCVAIKVLAPHLASSSLAKKRFAREAQAAAAVVHPHVLAIHQVQPNGRLPFLVMPLVCGESLAERLTAQGSLELKETLRIGMQAAAGLAAAHEQGLVHRDIKPANILLEKGVERAVLTDFGLARAADDVTLTRWGIVAGTPQYMSPEQARGEPLDGRSDLFSLGCVLYEMATGASPFRTDSMMATMRRLVDDSPQAMGSLNPELPPWFIGIVDRLLEKDPSRRFGSAKEVSELLEGCLAHVQQPAAVPLPVSLVPHVTYGRWIFNSHRKGVIAMLGVLGISLLGMVLWQASEAPDIAGKWAGEVWGAVVLEAKEPGQYEGSYKDTDHSKSGTVHLKWSRVERRFNGTWAESDDRNGKISLRLVGDEIRGAWTTDKNLKTETGTPELADLLWKRTSDKQERPALSKIDADKANAETLTGSWTLAFVEKNGKKTHVGSTGTSTLNPITFAFDGAKFLITYPGQSEEVSGTYTLVVHHKSADLDLVVSRDTTGSQVGEGRTDKYLCQIEGDTLKLASYGLGYPDRPKSFQDEHMSIMWMQRLNPNDRKKGGAKEAEKRLLQIDLEEAKAKLAVAESRFERISKLNAARAVEDALLVKAKAQLDVANVQVERQKLRLEAFQQGGDTGLRERLLNLDVREAALKFTAAESEYGRMKRLRDVNAVSEEFVDNAKLTFDLAKTDLERANANLKSFILSMQRVSPNDVTKDGATEQAKLFAKVSGLVQKVHVDIGDHVKKGQLLAELFAPELDAEMQQHAKVYAPFDCIVVKRNAVKGMFVNAAGGNAEPLFVVVRLGGEPKKE